jgi:broad specificity phosphatase PhoE
VSVAAGCAEDATWWIARHFAGEFRQDAYRRLDNVLHHVAYAEQGAPVVVQQSAVGLREVV